MQIESILSNEVLTKIGKEKAVFLLDMLEKVKTAQNNKDMIRIFKDISAISKQSDIRFSKEEFQLICAILKQNGTEEERNKIEKCLKTFAEKGM